MKCDICGTEMEAPRDTLAIGNNKEPSDVMVCHRECQNLSQYHRRYILSFGAAYSDEFAADSIELYMYNHHVSLEKLWEYLWWLRKRTPSAVLQL